MTGRTSGTTHPFKSWFAHLGLHPTTSQKGAFLAGEGDQWFRRNPVASDSDPILRVIEQRGLDFSKVLEIGCSDGRRLTLLKKHYPKASFKGVDPSRKATCVRVSGVVLSCGVADDLPYESGSFDLVIYGFCLYLCDRTDLFKIAAEGDRVLQDGGTMIIYDFHAMRQYRNPYKHLNGLFSYKMDHSRLFSWNPAYRVISQDILPHPGTSSMAPDNLVGITIMQKNLAVAWENA